MTREEIVRIAREAGLTQIVKQHDDGTVTLEVPNMPKLERFADLVADAARGDCGEGWEDGYKAGAAAEREACARVCEDKVAAERKTGKVDHNEIAWTQACAFAIRERA